MTDLIIRPITADDYKGWDPLYLGYAEFYKVASSVVTSSANPAIGSDKCSVQVLSVASVSAGSGSTLAM